MPDFQDKYTRELLQLLRETFENAGGIYLERETSLGQTLAAITAERASEPVAPQGTSIAAHVGHLTFYLELLEGGLHGPMPENVDWEETWRSVTVTPEEWTQMQERLQSAYRQLVATVQTPGVWDAEHAVGDALAIVAHSAYHLGAIRQILLVLAGA